MPAQGTQVTLPLGTVGWSAYLSPKPRQAGSASLPTLFTACEGHEHAMRTGPDRTKTRTEARASEPTYTTALAIAASGEGATGVEIPTQPRVAREDGGGERDCVSILASGCGTKIHRNRWQPLNAAAPRFLSESGSKIDLRLTQPSNADGPIKLDCVGSGGLPGGWRGNWACVMRHGIGAGGG